MEASRAGGKRTAGEKLEDAELEALPNLEDAVLTDPDVGGVDEYEIGVDVIGVGCHVDEYAVGAEGKVGEVEGTPRTCECEWDAPGLREGEICGGVQTADLIWCIPRETASRAAADEW